MKTNKTTTEQQAKQLFFTKSSQEFLEWLKSAQAKATKPRYTLVSTTARN